MVNIIIPSLGESITEATIAKWYKNQGDAVVMDEIILEIETEKVTLEVTAASNGVLESILKKDGDTVAVGEKVGAINPDAKGKVAAETKVTDSPSVNNTGKISTPSAVSPAAAKIAQEQKIDINNISGSGPKGRVTKADVLNTTKIPVGEKHQNNITINTERVTERVKMSKLRKTIAQRLKASQNTAAILSTFNEVDMHNIMHLRKQYKEAFEKKHGIKLGFMSFFVKAVIAALQEIPAVNAEIIGEEIIYKYYYDIGIAVGTSQGLVVPVVRNAEKLNFAEIEQTISNLGKKARDNKLTMDDLTGGTFSITNGGIYGSLLSTPIINPPQAAILGMHNIVEKPVAIAGKVEIRPMMYLALSYDHRLIDGKEAVTFLVKIKEAIENPERLLLGI